MTDATDTTTALEGFTCQNPACGNAATLQCPKCLELELESEFSTFCSQDCFKVRTVVLLILILIVGERGRKEY